MPLEELNKGDKVDVHVTLYASEMEVIDALCRRYDCSRAAVIGAWAREFAPDALDGKVKAGRRPGGGRRPVLKRKKRKTT